MNQPPNGGYPPGPPYQGQPPQGAPPQQVGQPGAAKPFQGTQLMAGAPGLPPEVQAQIAAAQAAQQAQAGYGPQQPQQPQQAPAAQGAAVEVHVIAVQHENEHRVDDAEHEAEADEPRAREARLREALTFPGAQQQQAYGAPQGAYPGAPQQGGYPGAPQQGAYPGQQQAYGAPQGAYPGAPQQGYPGAQQPQGVAPQIGIGGFGPGGMPKLNFSGGVSRGNLIAAVIGGQGFAKPRLTGAGLIGLSFVFGIVNTVLVLVLHRYYMYLYSAGAIFGWSGTWMLLTGQPLQQADGSKAPGWGRVGLMVCFVIGTLVGIALSVFNWEHMLFNAAVNGGE